MLNYNWSHEIFLLQLPHVPNSAVNSPVGPSRGSTDFPLDGITLAGLLQDSDNLLSGQLRPTHLAPILEDAARGEGEDESGIVMTGGGEDDDESVEGRHTESEGQIISSLFIRDVGNAFIMLLALDNTPCAYAMERICKFKVLRIYI